VRGDTRVALKTGPARLALQPGMYAIRAFPPVFEPFTVRIEAGKTNAIIKGGILDFHWPGEDAWMAFRGDTAVAAGRGRMSLALQPGRYVIKAVMPVFEPVTVEIEAGVTNSTVVQHGILDFRCAGDDLWVVSRGDTQVTLGKGSTRLALQPGRYVVTAATRVFEPVTVEIEAGVTHTITGR
jgi:hypothetical protein